MSDEIYHDTVEIMPELEDLKKDNCHVPQVFAEVFKDEINANVETDLYDNVRNIVNRYSKDRNAINIINEFTEAISGGASLNEILQITRDEILEPTPSTELTTDRDCET